MNVFIKDSYKGAATNQDGYYVITDIPKGEYEVIASIIGFKMVTQKVTLGESENIRLDFRLNAAVLAGEEVNVSAERIKFQKMVEPSRVTLGMREINAAPAFIEADLFRTIQLLPGVQTLNDFSSALYVRGSTPDQNLILLDGITIYNPYHIGGLFSTFNTDAIKEANFHAGGFPARYGGRMGAILNVISKEGNTEKFEGKTNISLLSAKGVIEGPLPKWKNMKGSWMLAGRKTYFDTFFNLMLKIGGENEFKFPYYFYDYQGKINLDFGDNHRLTYSRFFGDDVLSNKWEDSGDEYFSDSREAKGKFDWRWGNHTNSLTWRWIANPNLILKTFLASSRFRFHIDINNESWYAIEEAGEIFKSYDGYFFDVYDVVSDQSLETELTWIVSDAHTITTGAQIKNVNFDLGMEFKVATFDTTISTKPLEMKSKTGEQSIYFQDRWQMSNKISTQIGGRLSRYSLHDKINIEPRLGLKYFVRDDVAIKLNWGRYYQYLTIANPQDESFRFIDIWMGIPKEYKAPSSDHFILGLEYISDTDIIYRIEVYYKSFDHLLTLKEGSPFEENDQLRFNPINEFYDTDAVASGLEILIKKTTGKYKGWIGYTFAKTEWYTKTDGWYPPKYDRTHTINVVGDWQWTQAIHASTAISFSSGNPFTPILGRYETWQETGRGWWQQSKFLVGEKNSGRYPAYFRWDVGLTKSFKSSWFGPGEYYFQFMNVTNHINNLFYIYQTNNDLLSNNHGKVQRKAFPMFPLLFTFGVRYDF
ncbi:MAG: TonB-dependent receptor [Candidatus Marinimicrobia bacterium]|nr:TonB-dependent receptor [Candidatus Neomarinimicrobiota bacterium]MBL7009644.1 TonB-dependent receptor [Candidatus Neomarinimicrobiota bacterium]MBL7029613.1 TonB-dependent receptor [Candidatus Neomarinimicrobiota bacterium]